MKSFKKQLLITIVIILVAITYLIYFNKPTKIVPLEPAMQDAFIEYMRNDLFSAKSYAPIHEINEAHKVFEVRKSLNFYYVYTYIAVECICGKDYSKSATFNPAIFVMIKNFDDTFKVIRYKEPLFGEDYVDSIKSLFPDYIAKNIIENNKNIFKEISKTYKKIK